MRSRPFTALVLTLLAAAGPAFASWTASGSFSYMDREYDQTGFTGVETPRAVRLADVEIIDNNAKGKNAVIATGVTTLNGSYSIFVNDSKTRDVYVRVIARSDFTGNLNIDVRESASGKAKHYAAATAIVSSHPPNANVNFGASVIQIGQGGQAFNLYDQLLRGVDYLAALNGARPGSDRPLAAAWSSTAGIGGSSYDPGTRIISMRDSGGYDDTVVLHEMGHYAVREYSATSTPGGAHTFSECDQDIRLAFDEGFASYWGNSSLRHHGLPGSNVYMRSNGGPGPGNLVRWADMEDDQEYLCQGSTSEVNVFSLLWDIVDGSTTPDTTPGVDDAHDLLDLSDAEVWEVMTGYLPGASLISLEDFWDGWFLAPIANGFVSEMIDIADHLAIEYYEDAQEVNDDAASAAPILPDGSATHGTFFRDADGDGAGGPDDVDFHAFSASAGQLYVAETMNLLSDGNTLLEILDSDGLTVLASNNDRAPGDDSSRIEWTAPRSDTFFARVRHASDLGVYGSYDLVLTTQNPVDNDGDGFDTSTDCNDNDPSINPGAQETCDGIDQDCDGVIDNGFDLDGDGFTTCAGDCDDTDPNVNPGVAEVPGNGIDDNCNGVIDEVVATDTVTITKAAYNNGPKKLTVEATSDQQPGVTLTLVGFGPMSFDSSRGLYVFVSARGTPDPGTVTVESSGGGSDTAVVTGK